MSNKWTCPKCKGYVKSVESDVKCIICNTCGRYFDDKGKEIKVNIDLYSLNTIGIKCDLN